MTSLQPVQIPTPASTSTEGVFEAPPEIRNFADALDLVRQALQEMLSGLIVRLPLVVLGLLIVIGGVFVARYVGRWTERGLRRTAADPVAVGLTGRLLRFVVVIVFMLLALSVAGVNIGVALAGIGIAGLAIAFALQNILENFVSGVLLMTRKPFRAGDQIQTGDVEGTVQEIDLRVTKIVGFAGSQYLVPNADVIRNVLVNFTRRGKRRSSVFVGIDYRDDHLAAFDVLGAAVRSVGAVFEDPEPEVLLSELGDSGVLFEIRFWTRPQNRNIRHTESQVIAAAKTAVEAAGMTVPWPIRTLHFDNPLPPPLPGEPDA